MLRVPNIQSHVTNDARFITSQSNWDHCLSSTEIWLKVKIRIWNVRKLVILINWTHARNTTELYNLLQFETCDCGQIGRLMQIQGRDCLGHNYQKSWLKKGSDGVSGPFCRWGLHPCGEKMWKCVTMHLLVFFIKINWANHLDLDLWLELELHVCVFPQPEIHICMSMHGRCKH